ncbi:MAG: glutamine amidotransferase [Phycisphaeraceae bacterium]
MQSEETAPVVKPWLYMLTGHISEPGRSVDGDYPARFDRLFGLTPEARIVCDVAAGETPPNPAALGAVVVSGSTAMVTEKRLWMKQAGAWLAEAVHQGACPILAICFGHQLLARALGGRVGPLPTGPEYGTTRIHRTPAGGADPLFAALPEPHWQQQIHTQAVLEPPPDATVLAETRHDSFAAMRFGKLAWGVQFHPETTARGMVDVMAARRTRLVEAGVDVDRLTSRVVDHGHGGMVAAAFRRIATVSLT